MHVRDILALCGGKLPAGRLVAFHLLGDSAIGQRGRAGLGPDGIAVGMVAVMMGIENILHRLGGDALDVGHGGAGAVREVGIDHDQIVFHFDDDVVAVAEVFEVAFAEPHPGRDLRDGFKFGVAA